MPKIPNHIIDPNTRHRLAEINARTAVLAGMLKAIHDRGPKLSPEERNELRIVEAELNALKQSWDKLAPSIVQVMVDKANKPKR